MQDGPKFDPPLVAEIETELQKCNEALERLGTLLSTDGIDPTLLEELRDSVSIRISASAAQKSIADGERMTFERLLAGERARSIARMCEQLSEHIGCHELKDCPDFEKLLEELTKLTVMIGLKQSKVNPRFE